MEVIVKKRLFLLIITAFLMNITDTARGNISGSGIVGGALSTESIGETVPNRTVKTGTAEELEWLRNRVQILNEENKRLKNARNRNVSQQSRTIQKKKRVKEEKNGKRKF